VKSLLRVATEEPHESPRGMFEHGRARSFGKKVVTPKNASQRRYMEEIEKHDMMFAVGPGGTGKTYIAVAMAVSALLTKQVNRIILARPAVEAGERLGFLPGTLQQKIDPYMRPLYDALYDMLDADKLDRFLEKGIIEVAPLAFMRGRTLNDSFVILDEAQNTTSEQMKMFLTRLGFNSKAVVTGDVTQIDLPAGKKSGLVEALEVCAKIEGIGIAQFNEKDVVRHNLVQQIIRAYEEYDGSQPHRSSSGMGSLSRAPSPAKSRPKNLCEDDPEPPAGCARCTASTGAVSGSHAAGTGTCRGRSHDLFVSDAEIARMNQAFRKKKGPNRRAVVSGHRAPPAFAFASSEFAERCSKKSETQLLRS